MTQQDKYDELLQAANAKYAALKTRGADISYVAPECLPTIGSDQVKAMLWVLAGALVNVSAALPTRTDIFRGGLGGK